MAGRNQRTSADYFTHDADASMDEKVIYLESKFGHMGYALYFKFLERMTRADGFMLDWNEIKKTIYAAEFNISVTEIEQFVSECCRQEIKAFQIENEKIFSPGLLKRMRPLIEKREYNRRKYEEQKSRADKEPSNSVTDNHISDTEISEERRGEESKGKKSNTSKSSRKKRPSKPPAIEDVKKYFEDNGYKPEAGVKAWQYYDAGGWKDSRGNPVKNWKQKMQGIWFKPENEMPKNNRPQTEEEQQQAVKDMLS